MYVYSESAKQAEVPKLYGDQTPQLNVKFLHNKTCAIKMMKEN